MRNAITEALRHKNVFVIIFKDRFQLPIIVWRNDFRWYRYVKIKESLNPFSYYGRVDQFNYAKFTADRSLFLINIKKEKKKKKRGGYLTWTF